MGKMKVVVIGSGIGGAGVGALLQHAGFDVTILEKNPYLGGKCHTFEKGGFIVDAGVHMFSRGSKGPLHQINNEVEGNLQWTTRRQFITFQLAHKYQMYYRQLIFDPLMLASCGWGISMASIKSKPINSGKSGSHMRVDKMVNRMFRLLRDGGGIPGLMKMVLDLLNRSEVYLADLDEISSRDFLLRFTELTYIHQLFAYVSMILLVLPYTESSAGELLWCGLNQFWEANVSVPVGGARAIPAAYLTAFERDGGKLELGAEATEIVVDSGQAKSVKTGDGREFPADIIISNAGIKLTCNMVGRSNLPADYVKRVDELRMSYAYITKKYGLSKKCLDAAGAGGFFHIANVEPETMFDHLKTGEAPLDPQLFTTIPTELDYTIGEPGKQLVIMGVPGPIEGTKESNRHCDLILDKGEERLFDIYPDIEKNAEWTMKTNTHYYGQMTGKDTGDCIGLGQYVGQTGIHRPGVKMPVDHLYLVGSDAGSRGVGTELAAESAIRLGKMLESEFSTETARTKEKVK